MKYTLQLDLEALTSITCAACSALRRELADRHRSAFSRREARRLIGCLRSIKSAPRA